MKGLLVLLTICTPFSAYAYIGPGLGLGALGVVLGFIVSLFLAIIGVFWFPIKRALKKKKTSTQKSLNEGSEHHPIIEGVYSAFTVLLKVSVIFTVGFIYASLEQKGVIKTFFTDVSETLLPVSKIEDLNITVYQPEKVHDELVMICPPMRGSEKQFIYLTNNTGDIVHKWEQNLSNLASFSEKKGYGDVSATTLSACVHIDLLPNGNALIMARHTFRNLSSPEYRLYPPSSLTLLDSDSNVIWESIGDYHHHFNINDKSEVFVISGYLREDNAPVRVYGQNNIITEGGYINKIDIKSGTVVESISVSEAFINSKYKEYIPLLDENAIDAGHRLDPYHLNSIEYIEKEQAELIGFLEEGDLLLSIVNQHLIAILRPSEGRIIRAFRGPWKWQHNAKITDKGTISLYDNGGEVAYYDKEFHFDQSRVLEFDPVDNSVVVHYRNTPNEPPIISRSRSYFDVREDYFMIHAFKQARLLQVDKNHNPVWDIRLGQDALEEYPHQPNLKASIIKSFTKDSLSTEFLESLK